MKPFVKHFEKNTKGRDFAVGDIHGAFTRLEETLTRIGFNKEVDRLFSVGDTCDRNPESNLAVDYIYEPWFHSCLGNHEQMAIDFAFGTGWPMSLGDYAANGGAWNIANSTEERETIALAFQDLPLAMEVETDQGLVGIIHAECPFNDWDKFKNHELGEWEDHIKQVAQWERNRWYNEDRSHVAGLHALIVGHTPIEEFEVLGNVRYIDTMGWRPKGKFTVLDLSTLEVVS
jgi:serine/threonine protein phosphatase 1